jgi:Big-like domain-containing protein
LVALQNAAEVPIQAGSQATLLASGIAPGTHLAILSQSLPTRLGTVTADQDGVARADLTLPSSWHPGWHQVYLADTEIGDVVARSVYRVTVPSGCEAGEDSADLDGDGLIDACDGDPTDGPAADADADGLDNGHDNCPTVANPAQTDLDEDLVGDVCEVGEGTDWLDDVRDVSEVGPPPKVAPAIGFDSNAHPVYGEAVQVAVHVTAQPGATGDVTLDEGNHELGTASLEDGVATFTLPAGTAAGAHELTAHYAGSDYVSPGSATVTVTIDKATPGLTLDVPDAVTFGAHPSVTATLSGAGPFTTPVSLTVGATTVPASQSNGPVTTFELPATLLPGSYPISSAFGGDGNHGSASATTTLMVNPAQFVMAAGPTITGTPQVGSVLTATAGTWHPLPQSVAYQWQSGSSPIAGATGSSYVPVAADLGRTLSVSVTVSRPGYDASTKSSSSTAPVSQAAAPPVTSPVTPPVTPQQIANGQPPAVKGKAVVGKTLVASSGSWAPGDVTLSYQWLRDGKVIGAATSIRYKVGRADKGHRLSVRVTASAPGYTSGSAVSASTAKVKVKPKPRPHHGRVAPRPVLRFVLP